MPFPFTSQFVPRSLRHALHVPKLLIMMLKFCFCYVVSLSFLWVHSQKSPSVTGYTIPNYIIYMLILYHFLLHLNLFPGLYDMQVTKILMLFKIMHMTEILVMLLKCQFSVWGLSFSMWHWRWSTFLYLDFLLCFAALNFWKKRKEILFFHCNPGEKSFRILKMTEWSHRW